VDFAPSAVADDYTKRMRAFLDDRILPAEAAYLEFRAARRGTPSEWELPPVVEELKAEARAQGLWNLFLPSISGLSNLEYAAIAEISGWSPVIAPEAINCQAPDTGNMELLHLLGSEEQKQRWLAPLLDGEIRSAFAMTEPDVASSDATNIATRIERDGDEYVITGRKWWTSGAMDPRCAVLIVMGKTDPAALPSEAAGLKDRPEAENLVVLYAALAETSKEQVLAEFGGRQFSDFKPALADLAVEKLAPIAGEMRRISADQAYVDSVLRGGTARAAVLAESTMRDVRAIVGLLDS